MNVDIVTETKFAPPSYLPSPDLCPDLCFRYLIIHFWVLKNLLSNDSTLKKVGDIISIATTMQQHILKYSDSFLYLTTAFFLSIDAKWMLRADFNWKRAYISECKLEAQKLNSDWWVRHQLNRGRRCRSGAPVHIPETLYKSKSLWSLQEMIWLPW